MAWNDKVFDNLEQIYWSPNKIGLVPIQKSLIQAQDGLVVPRELIEGGKSLYSRRVTAAEWKYAIAKDEELLNHVLEIGFAVAPRRLLAEAFFSPLGIEAFGRITTIGRETDTRYRHLEVSRFIQQDGFYLADNSIVAMEMKLKARTSIEQYLKYCMLIALEEMVSGPRESVGLIYIVPKKSVRRTRKDLLLDEAGRFDAVWESPRLFTDKRPLLALIDKYSDAFLDVGRRLIVTVTTWDDLLSTLTATLMRSSAEGDETLSNLAQGMIDQIVKTPDCGIGSDVGTPTIPSP